jgi:MFS family permease
MNPWRGIENLPRAVWVVVITTFINRAGTMMFPLLYFYLTDLNFSTGQKGFILALFGIGSLITAPLSGWLSDKIGALQVMKLSLVLSGMILLIYYLAHSFILIALLTLLWAISSEAFRPASAAILSSVVMHGDDEKARKDSKRAQALHRFAMNLGMVFGPPVASIFAIRHQWQALFIIDGATSVLAFVYLSVMLRPAKFQTSAWEIHTTESATIPTSTSRAIKDRRFLYFLLATVPVLVIFFQEYSAIPQFMNKELGLGAYFYGLLVGINAALVAVFELWLNYVTGAWPYRKSLMWGAGLCAVGFGSLAFANGFAFMVIAVVIWTFGEMFLLPNMFAYTGSIAPKRRLGEYMGFLTMMFSLSMILAPSIGLIVLQQFGSKVLWSAAFVLSASSILMVSRIKQTE